jgi:hypothetical protein
MTLDRQALATDLESLGLKAIAGAVRNDSISVERVMRSVERTRDRKRKVGDSKGAEAAQSVLNRWWGKGS